MRRLELIPSRRLRQDIQCIWAVEELSMLTSDEAVLPDPYRELVLDCGAALALENAPGVRYDLPHILLNDLQSASIRLRTTESCCLIGVRFFPWAVQSFFGPQKQILDTSLRSLSSIWKELAVQITHTVKYQNVEAAMYTLDVFLKANYPAPQSDGVIVSVVRELLSAQDIPPKIQDIARDVSLSVSQFERRFKQATGVLPKTLTRLIRFEAVCDAVWQNPKQSLAALAATFGYADQAHFIHDFKSLASETPAAFARRAKNGTL
jgi:AraC-like DNA-binding protein